ncbi:hypothetical protein [Vibrio coralliirubri]|uniref:hypothetical protein n=1 Tax=Vibrio coralliirubri TaxID=1516159 RepID=UPI0006301FE3|nr:hypothetical protein [Vibrio coralliirubri]CDT54333.1 conserved membrane hypothetical protein [Vibrio coralliirubri]
MKSSEMKWFKLAELFELTPILVVLVMSVIFGLSAGDFGGALFNKLWFEITPYFFGFVAIVAVLAKFFKQKKVFGLAKDVDKYLFSSLIGAILGAVFLFVSELLHDDINYRSLLFYASLFLQGLVYVVIMSAICIFIGFLINNRISRPSVFILLISLPFFAYVFYFNKQDTTDCVTQYRDTKEICNLEDRYTLVNLIKGLFEKNT